MMRLKRLWLRLIGQMTAEDAIRHIMRVKKCSQSEAVAEFRRAIEDRRLTSVTGRNSQTGRREPITAEKIAGMRFF